MSEFRVASRYAKSLIDLGKEQNALDQLAGDMRSFLTVFHQNPELRSVLKNPVITGDKKLSVLTKIFGASTNKIMMPFFEIIIRKNRFMFLEAIADAFISQYNELNNITTAEVKSAVALDENTSAEIKRFIAASTGKNVEIKTSVDPRLIGGVVIKMDDKLFDASIAGKLKKAKQQLLNTYISK